MIRNVTNAAELSAALRAAEAGDTVLLAPGNYGLVRMSELRASGEIIIASAIPGNMAVFTGLSLRDSTGITLRDLEFSVNPAGGEGQFLVTRSQNIKLDGVRVHGSLNGNPQDDRGGLMVSSSANVTITGSEFEQLYWGITHNDVEGLTITDNGFHDLRMDGVRGSKSSHVLIAENNFKDFYPVVGDHADAIQFWSMAADHAAREIVIRDNVILRGSGGLIQGILFNSGSGPAGFQDVSITSNLVLAGEYNGITVLGATNTRITDNMVSGFTERRSWIRVEEVLGGEVTRNIMNFIMATPDNLGVNIAQNTEAPQATDGGVGYYQQWMATHGAQAGMLLVGGTGSDTLIGAAGADTLSGGGGQDLLEGGGGDDLYVTDGRATIRENADGGIDTVQTKVGYTLGVNLENLEMLGTANSSGTGNGLDNRITGNSGANKIAGKGGADSLDGGAGDDTISGGSGNDVLTGGAGADTFVFAKGDGVDRIVDWGSGGHDRIDISALLGAGFLPTVAASAAGVTISFATGDSIFLVGVTLESLHPNATGWVF